VIRINLLPPELRPKTEGRKWRIPWRQTGYAAAACVAVYSGWLVLVPGQLAQRITRTQAELERLRPEKARFLEVQGSVQSLRRRGEAVQAIKAPDAQWAPRLNLLSDALVPQVWLTRLDYTGDQDLLVEGRVALDSPNDSGQVSRFMQQLKEQPDFSRLFRDAELQSVEHRQIESQEVVDFVLLLRTTGQGP